MKTVKKLLSLLLVAVMLVSTLSIAVFAVVPTIGAEEDGKLNIKITVEKETGTITDAGNGGSYDGSAGDLYAVSAYMKCSTAVPIVYFPLNYNKEHFKLITIIGDVDGDGDDDMYYGDETFNADMGGDTTVYMYEEGDFKQYTGNYRANGTTATLVAQQVCYGLGSSKATGYEAEVKSIDSNHSEYANWAGSLDSTVGIVKIGFDAYTSKHAYLNTTIDSTNGIKTTTEDVRLITLYFQRVAGVSEADCIGDEFGAFDANSGIFDNVVDNAGAYYTTPSVATVDMTYTNAVIEESRTPLAFSEAKEQIRFQKNTDGTYAGKFDYRLITNITNFSTVFAGYTNDQLDDKTAPVVKGAGYYFLVGGAAPTVETLKSTGTPVTVNGIATGTAYGDYVMACVVTDIPDADKGEALHAVAYVTYELDGETYTDYSDVMTSESFNGLYNQYYNNAFPSA